MLLLGLAACSLMMGGESGRSQTGHTASDGVVVEAKPYSRAPDSVLNALGDGLAVEAVFSLTSAHPAFGGLSGIWMAPDGSRMIAVSDRGRRWQARLHHDATGRLTGLDRWSVARLPHRSGEGRGVRWVDSEALAGQGADGLVVAYEGQHRLRRWSLDDLEALPEHVTLPDGLGEPSNSGIEALSSLGGGRLFALAERVGAWGGEGLMGWIIDGSTAADLAYIPAPGFAPTGAARLEQTIYLVERRFSLLSGFRTRIATLPVAAIAPGARLEGTELASFRWDDIGENFEGIAARRAPDGRVLLYLLADDNFSFLQETLLVQLSLPPSEPADGRS